MKRLALATIFALSAGLATPALAQSNANPATSSLTIPSTGTGTGGTFAGTFDLRRFAVQDGAVYAVGTLTGVVTTAAGATTSIVRNIALPTAVGTTTCDILHLDLGPLNLDLLGLNIDLSQVVLDITAEAGAGNLLGNLLCGVVNLLNDPSGLSRLLNNILAILG
jgi:hypothetical protein